MKKILVTSMMLMGLLVGCSKEKETKLDPELLGGQYIKKSSIVGDSSTHGRRLYSLYRGIDEADSRNTIYAVPGFSYDFGVVTPVVTETALEFHAAVEFDNNQQSYTVVASFPILKHFDIVKQTNDYGELTNQVVQDTKRPWNEREYMQVDWTKPIKGAVTNQLWSIGNLVESEGNLLKPYKVDENGRITFSTESLITEDAGQYFDEMGNVAGGNYRVKTTTYMIPMKSSTFKAREYSDTQFGKYGLFRTFENYQDPERGPLDTTVKHYANLFNVCAPGGGDCSTNKIVYHLTNFPEDDSLATSGYITKQDYINLSQQAVNAWNVAFKKALGRNDDVVVLETAEVPLSDPNYNEVAWYASNTESGLLGVSQTRVDNTTGETLAARATMYGSGIKYTVAHVEDYIHDMLDAGGIPGCTAPVGPTAVKGKAKVNAYSHLKITPQTVLGNKTKFTKPNLKAAGVLPTSIDAMAKTAYENSKANVQTAYQRRNTLYAKEAGNMIPLDFNILRNMQNKTPGDSLQEVYEDALLNKQSPARKMAKQQELKLMALGIHGTDLVDEATQHYVAKFAQSNPQLCADPNKFIQAIKGQVAKLTYFTTALHEMGHNFGLRHNFHGSADTDTNYTPKYQEIKTALATGNNPNGYTELDLDFYAYTSVMDYSAAFYEEEGGLGPYDLAAIRFAYNPSLPANDPAVTANFQFCTDHMVGEDTLCTRFDKGQNLSQTTLFNIERYNRGYVKSHLRRNRLDFDNSVGGVIFGSFTRYMIPTRQVLDELIYQIITSPPAAQNEYGCTSQFMLDSVASGEIANVCDPAAAEDNFVNVLDWGTMVNGLFTKASLTAGKPAFYMDPTKYKPNGFADLVFANSLARDFFSNVIGAPEADTYLLEPYNTGTYKLTQLPPGGTNEDRLAALAQSRSVTNITAFIQSNLSNLVPIALGPITAATPAINYRVNPIGTTFTSQVSLDGGYEKLQDIGYIWDKYVAMITLGMRYIGVEKYARMSMAGNAYLWPQGKKWTTDIIDAMVTKRQYLAQSWVTTAGGQTVMAYVPASEDINLQAIGVMIGVADLATDTDSSFVDKLRVCDSTDGTKCNSSLGLPTVQFDSASGADVYKAAQTIDNDSIGFQMVSAGKKIADDRKQMMLNVTNAATFLSTAKAKMVAGETKRKALDILLLGEPTLASLAGKITANSGNSSVWVKSQDMINNIATYGTFKALGWRNEAVNQVATAYGQVDQSTTLNSAKKTQIETAILDYLQVLVQISSQGLPGALDDAVMIKIAPELVKIDSQDLNAQETMISLTRRYMKWLALD